MTDNLTIDEVENLANVLKDKMPTQGFFILCLRQLSDTMRENQRLQKALKSVIDNCHPCPSCHRENECYVFSISIKDTK